MRAFHLLANSSRDAVGPLPLADERAVSPETNRRFFFAILIAAAALLSLKAAPWLGLAFFASILLFLSCGAALAPAPDPQSAARTLAFFWGLGLAACYLLWTASAYLCGGVGPGVLATLALAAFGLARRRAPLRAALREASASPEMLAISSLALIVGLYTVGVNDLRVGDELLYTYRYDWGQHAAWSAMVREAGLPLPQRIGCYPPPGICHTGYFSLVAGLDRLVQAGVLQAMRLLHLQAFWLLALAAYALVSDHRCGRLGAIAAAASPLLWAGCLGLQALFQFSLDPLLSYDGQGLFLSYILSGSAYYNGTQALCLALTASALPALGDSRPPAGRFALGCLVLVAAAQVKPSIFVVFGPALLIVLALARADWRRWAAALATWMLTAALYALPLAFGLEGDDGFSWALRWERLLDLGALNEMLMVLGAALPFLALALVALARAATKERRWSAEQLAGLALFGSVAFALLFIEREREVHGNHLWPLLGAAALFAPFVIARLFAALRSRESGPGRSLWWLAAIIAGQQLVSGLCFAALYPLATPHRIPQAGVRILDSARRLSSPERRFLVTAALSIPPSAAYLGRPALWNHWSPALVSPDPKGLERWKALESGAADRLGPELDRYDAALIKSGSRLAALFAREGWQRTRGEGLDGFELWQREKK